MTEVIEGKFGGGKQFRPTVGGKSYVADERTEIRWFLAVCTARSALLALCTRGGRAGREEGAAGCEKGR